MPTARYPCLFQLNTRVELTAISRRLGRPATFDDLDLNDITGDLITTDMAEPVEDADAASARAASSFDPYMLALESIKRTAVNGTFPRANVTSPSDLPSSRIVNSSRSRSSTR